MRYFNIYNISISLLLFIWLCAKTTSKSAESSLLVYIPKSSSISLESSKGLSPTPAPSSVLRNGVATRGVISARHIVNNWRRKKKTVIVLFSPLCPATWQRLPPYPSILPDLQLALATPRRMHLDVFDAKENHYK